MTKSNVDVFSLLSNRKLTLLFVIVMFILTVFFSSHEYLTYSFLSIFIIIGTVVSLLFFPSKSIDFSLKYSKKHMTLILIIFYITYTLSIIDLLYYESIYSKSIIYYSLIGICASMIFLITFSENKILSNFVIPYMLLLLGFNIFFSTFVTFPNGVYASSDTHYNIYKMLQPLIQTGVIPINEIYSPFPIHTIYVYLVSLVANFNSTKTYIYLNSTIYALISLLIYSISGHIFNKKVGIISTLLFMSAPNIVYHATHAYQFSYAFPYAIISFYILILSLYNKNEYSEHKPKQLSYSIINIIIITTIIWTHPFTSMIIFATIILIYLFWSIILGREKETRYIINTIILFVTILFLHWMYSSSMLSLLVTVIRVYTYSLFIPENYQNALDYTSSYLNYNTHLLIFFDSVGICILFFLSTIGFYFGVSHKNKYILTLTFLGTSIWGLFSVGTFLHMPFLLGGRLLNFFWTFCIIFLASLGIMCIVNKIKMRGVLFCCLLVFVITTSNLGNTVSGPETSVFIGNQPYVSLYDTNSDLNSYTWIQQYTPNNSSIRLSEPGSFHYMDSNRIYSNLPMDNLNHLNLSHVETNSYMLLRESYSSGILIRNYSEAEQITMVTSRKQSTAEAEASRIRLIKVKYSELMQDAYGLNSIYSNGKCNIKIA